MGSAVGAHQASKNRDQGFKQAAKKLSDADKKKMMLQAAQIEKMAAQKEKSGDFKGAAAAYAWVAVARDRVGDGRDPVALSSYDKAAVLYEKCGEAQKATSYKARADLMAVKIYGRDSDFVKKRSKSAE